MKTYKCKTCWKEVKMSELMFDNCKACDYDKRIYPELMKKINSQK